jgi:hypothetical protein
MWSVTHTTDVLSVMPRSIRQNAAPTNSAQSLSRVEVVEFDGMVWCPRTPSRNWLARREGTVFFTGNTYSKPPPVQVRNVQAQELGVGSTGIELWDTAIQFLSKRKRANGVFFGQIRAFDTNFDAAYDQVIVREDCETGQLHLLGPADMNRENVPGFGFDVNSQAFPQDPGVL